MHIPGAYGAVPCGPLSAALRRAIVYPHMSGSTSRVWRSLAAVVIVAAVWRFTLYVPDDTPAPVAIYDWEATRYRLRQSTVERIRLGGEYGEHGYFTRMRHVCLMPAGRDGRVIFVGRRTPETFESLADGATHAGGGPSQLSQGLHSFVFIDDAQRDDNVSLGRLRDDRSVPGQCRVGGRTWVHDYGALEPGHIGHFSEDVLKAFSVLRSPHAGPIDQMWLANNTRPIVYDSQRALVRAALGPNVGAEATRFVAYDNVVDDADTNLVALNRAAGLPPIGHGGTTLARQCRYVCFDEAVMTSKAQFYQMSPANSDDVRRSVYASCGVDTFSKVRARSPRLLVIQRGKPCRISNAKAVVAAATRIGFEVTVLNDRDLGDFCNQVRAFADADALLATPGAVMVNSVYMRAHSVVLQTLSLDVPRWKIIGVHASLSWIDVPVSSRACTDEVKRHRRPFDCDVTLGPMEAVSSAFHMALDLVQRVHDTSNIHATCMELKKPHGSGTHGSTLHEMNVLPCLPPASQASS